MAKIAVVGSGINGLVAAHGLLKQGHAVALISERASQRALTPINLARARLVYGLCTSDP